MNAKTLETVTHTHTHTLCLLNKNIKIINNKDSNINLNN